jgi:sporulation protein and related proteins
MKKRKIIKSAAVIMAGTLAVTGTVSVPIYAQETETADTSSDAAATETTAENTSTATTAADETTVPVSASEAETNAVPELTEEPINWVKTDISDYGSSMSLISYEVTTPEMLGEKKEASSDKKELTEEEIEAMVTRRKAIKKASPSLTRKSRNAEPTAVELYLSGKPVGDVPPDRDLSVEAQPGEFAFVTYGWGHGVGMSQNGANFYATYSGWTYQDILFHYYPGTYLMNTEMTDEEELTVGHVPAGDTLDIISQIVYNEVGSSMAYEAIKAQAVAAYTYMKYNGDDSNDLIMKPDPPQIVIDACSEVLGEALFYDGDYALTMFSASSGGCSANCYEVFYQDIPYLTSVQSDYDGAYDPHYGTVTYISESDLKNRIQSLYGITLSDDPNNWIQPIYSEQTGYATDVLIDGQMYVRAYAFSLAMGLKSCKFNLTYNPPVYTEEPTTSPEDSDFKEDYEEAHTTTTAAEPTTDSE